MKKYNFIKHLSRIFRYNVIKLLQEKGLTMLLERANLWNFCLVILKSLIFFLLVFLPVCVKLNVLESENKCSAISRNVNWCSHPTTRSSIHWPSLRWLTHKEKKTFTRKKNYKTTFYSWINNQAFEYASPEGVKRFIRLAPYK